MTEIETTRDTVAIDEAVHGIYRQLTEGNDPLGTPFRTMKDVFMWAACLGYRRGKRNPLVGRHVTIFRWAQFSPQLDIPLLKALAISDCGAVDVVMDQDQLILIAEELANAGIADLRNITSEDHLQPLWNLVEVLKG